MSPSRLLEDAIPHRREHRSPHRHVALERGHDVIEASVIASEATDEDLIAMSRLQACMAVQKELAFEQEICTLAQAA